MSSGKERPTSSLPPEVCASLLEEAPVGVCVVQDGRIVYANRWLRRFGARADDGSPEVALGVIHPDDRPLASRQMQLRLAGQATSPSCTVRLLKSDGEVRHAEFHDRKIDFQGRPAIQGTLVDVTSRIDADRNLQEHVARLGEANRFHKLFGEIVSHDLMNPVWIAENYLRLVMDGGGVEDKRSFYEGMRGSLARARGLLADARTYLKIRDLVAFSGENIDLGQLVETVARSFEALCREKNQQIAVNVPGGAVICASPLVKEVVSQLLSNALKFGPAGSVIGVSVGAGPRVRLEVKDGGPGVPEQERERIFERFENWEKGPIVGAGLGLAIVRRVVELHRGTVWVEGNPDGGSVFVVEFPAGC